MRFHVLVLVGIEDDRDDSLCLSLAGRWVEPLLDVDWIVLT